VNARGVTPPTISLHADANTGDVGFGDPALYAAFVDGRLEEALREGDKLAFTECCMIVESPFASREGRVPSLVDGLAHAARRLIDATSDGRPNIAKMLLQNVTSDESSAVRARSIDSILARVEDDDEVRESAIASALEDDAQEVRLAAARHLGERGFAVAEAIARDEEAADGLRQRALRFLMRRFEAERVVPILRDALESDNERVVQLAVRRLGELAHVDAIPWLADLAERATAETAVAIATALGAIGDPSGELALIGLYEKHFDEVKIAAADALGTTGTAAAVSHLLPAAESTRVPTELRVPASNAVKLIQSRLGGKSGSLSVIEAKKETGHVSIAAGGRGALSEPVGADKKDQIELSK
jgi:hypothetical protein